MFACACGGPKLMSGVSLDPLPPYGHGLSLELEWDGTVLIASLPQNSLCLPFSAGITGGPSHASSMYLGSGNPDSGPQSGAVGALTREPYPSKN